MNNTKNQKNSKKSDRINQILNDVLEEIKPNHDYPQIKEFVQRINQSISKLNYDADVFIGGSFAKNTHLKQDFDCDIFVRFSLNYRNDQLSQLLEKVLKEFNPLRIHGSRDYFSLDYKQVHFEIIPVYRIEKIEQAQNITDVSPIHVTWFKKYQDLCDEVRLTKQFMKAQKVYGAESYIKGFSGHVVDILTVYYKSFLNLLKNARKWSFPLFIDVENLFSNENPLFYFNQDKISNEIIIVDPIQKQRNAAAALSKEKAKLFMKKAQEFLENPNKDYFKVTFMNEQSIKEQFKSKNILLVIFKAEPIKGKSKDVTGTKAYTLYQKIHKELLNKEFKVKNTEFDWDGKNKIYFYFTFAPNLLSEFKLIQGPPNQDKFKENIKIFKKKYKDIFVKDSIFYAKVRRDFRNPIEFLEKYLDLLRNNKDLKEHVNDIELLSYHLS